MKKILAISGGVDSMCLLHMMRNDEDVVVAHFNHGTRPSSDDDEAFVKSYAKKYGLPFYAQKAQLGSNVSEADARVARYAFLYDLAKKLNGTIYTAHHLNDLVESITINFTRGTGWRGLTPFNNVAIKRPLLRFTKAEIYRYAAINNIIFRQDPTNVESSYLRNRLRPAIATLIVEQPDSAEKLNNLYLRQCSLRAEIEKLCLEVLPPSQTYERTWFKELDDDVAEELLRSCLEQHHISLTRPQLQDFLNAIRTYGSGKQFNLPKDQLIRFNKTNFML